MKLFIILYIGLVLMCIALLFINIYLLGISELIIISTFIIFFRKKLKNKQL